MFGGNATEQRQRTERFWYGLGGVAVAGGIWWFVESDRRTDASHLWLFWVSVLIAALAGAILAWKNADKEELAVTGGVTWAALGILLSNLLEDAFWVKATMFGLLAGLLLGGGLSLLVLVLKGSPSERSSAKGSEAGTPET